MNNDNNNVKRKLKLHVAMSIDGCIAGPNNEMDWIDFTWNEKMRNMKTGYTSLLIPLFWKEND